MNIESIQQIAEIAAQVIGVAAVVATITPTPVDDGILMTLKKVLSILAMNIGQAKNAK